MSEMIKPESSDPSMSSSVTSDVAEMQSIGSPGELAFLKGKRLFIPISLGNHYYSSNVMRRLVKDFVAQSDQAIIFLCDRLRLLSYLIRGKRDLEGINFSISKQMDQIVAALKNVGLELYSNGRVENWSFCQNDGRYAQLLSNLTHAVRHDPVLWAELEANVRRALRVHGASAEMDGVECAHLQAEYIIEETALSVYMTEIVGFNFEVYRRGLGFVDYLYDYHPLTIKSLTGKSILHKRFVSLENYG